jgi:hypothetical protein
MKRWALATVILYILVVSVLVTPPLVLLSGQDREIVWAFYAFFLPVLALVQAVLLVVPVRTQQARPVPRRTAMVSGLIGAIPMAVLVGAFAFFVLLMLFGEDEADTYMPEVPTLIGLGVVWLLWGVFFYRGFSADDPNRITSRISRWLLRGSILEILIAIPAHIISRHRQECCAPGFTLFGIATGLAVAALAFGPAVFFLLAGRVAAKKKAAATTAES